MSRPEHQAPPEIYYDAKEANKYTNNSRIIEIQVELAERALELLALTRDFENSSNTISDNVVSDSDTMSDTDSLPSNSSDELHQSPSEAEPVLMSKSPYLLLDIGVGSGLCASVLDSHHHSWIGLDISSSMLKVALHRQQAEELNSDGDLILSDAGDGIQFRPGIFDGAISISVLQWLCNADTSQHSPRSRLNLLFKSLYSALKQGSRAVFQFYPENSSQVDLILEAALKVGFNGGLVIDYPNSTKRKKYFLCLIAGSSSYCSFPKGKSEEGDEDQGTIKIHHRQKLEGNKSKRKRSNNMKDREWVIKKKALMRKRGYENIPEDSKYTARKRRPRF